MIIESISLDHYRNLNNAVIHFSPGINIFYGDNAQGKTNLLESVYLSATTRSHRSVRDRDLIRFGEDEAHIRMMFKKNDLTHRLDLHLRKNKSKGMALNGSALRKTGDLLGMIPVVFFSPEDLSIIKNGPAQRRRFMDMELSQLHKGYMQQLVLYHKVLTQRNNLLKQMRKFPELKETLVGWDEQLLSYGSGLIRQRKEFLIHLDEIMRMKHLSLTGQKEEIRIRYDINVDEKDFAGRLRESLDADIMRGSTSVGPHRDDIAFTCNEIDLRRFGSQGQQRTAALSLKLSEIMIMEESMDEKPVLLLDDVLSELDVHRQDWLLAGIEGTQTMITCTGLDEFVNKRIRLDKVFSVNEGKIDEKMG